VSEQKTAATTLALHYRADKFGYQLIADACSVTAPYTLRGLYEGSAYVDHVFLSLDSVDGFLTALEHMASLKTKNKSA
jgi:hypothetical protein